MAGVGHGFGGHVHPDDVQRLETQLARVRACLADGQWWTLSALRGVCGGSDAGVSARVRDLRKERFGGFVIERRRLRNGVQQYRMQGAHVAALERRASA